MKPGGISVTLSPWLIHTLSMPWPSACAQILDAVEQLRVAARAHFGVAELAHLAGLDLAAELLRHGLHAVADAEHRHAELEHRVRARVPVASSYADMWLPERMMPFGAEVADELVGDVVRMDLAVDVRFAHAARDQLRVLRAEIEDEDLFVAMHSFDAVVRRFLGDLHVVHVRLAHARRRDLDELGLACAAPRSCAQPK